MDVIEIRRRNIDVLKAEFQTLEAIADLMRKAAIPAKAEANYASVLTQIRGGKPMGHDFARRLEASVNKPKGWMDAPQFHAVDEAMEAVEAGQLAMNMAEEDRQAWLKHGRLLAQQNPKRSSGNPFGDVPKGSVTAPIAKTARRPLKKATRKKRRGEQ